MNLSSTIKVIQDIMRKDDGVDGDAQRIGQLTWMLFLKVFDQREDEWRGVDPSYASPLPQRFRWRNWAASKDPVNGSVRLLKLPHEIIPFVNSELFPFLREQINPTKSDIHKVIRFVFEDAKNEMKSGPLMCAVIENIEANIDFNDLKERSHLGDIYEKLLKDLRGAGNSGEFYTPRAITEFMVNRVAPDLFKRETVLDPACGTGGFLTATISHFTEQIKSSKGARPEDRLAIAELIHGFEKKNFPHLLCITNLMLHDIEVPSRVERKNTLKVGWNKWEKRDKFDCVITNPPFGGYEDMEAGFDYPLEVRTRETADMFMALIIKKLLKENGRAAVVLPDGFLFGEGVKNALKRMLLRDCNLHTIVRLPKGVFAPYTSIRTNLLFFTKGAEIEGGPERFHTGTVWFYEHPYPDGYKSYSKTKPIRFEEFAAEQAWWGSEEDDFASREENEFAWKYEFGVKRREAEAAAKPYWVKAKWLNNQAAALEERARELRVGLVGATDAAYRAEVDAEIAALREQAEPLRLQARDAKATGDRLYWPAFNLDQKNPRGPEEESHDPDVLLEKYKALLSAIDETQNQLKSELAAALAHHVSGEDV